jgi:hypothetical protein
MKPILKTTLIATLTLGLFNAWAETQPVYKLLSERRDSIQFPKYSVEQKKLVLDQVRMVMSQLYVHRDLKLKDFGPASDPLPLLNNLESKLDTISDYDFHKTMAEIFAKQRDWHTTYTFPKPYACYSSFLPVAFKEVKDLNGNKVIAVSQIVQKDEVMALMPDDFSIELGDVVLTYDGLPVRKAMKNIASITSGANPAAQIRNSADFLTYRGQMFNVLPEKNKTALVLKNRQGKTYSITVPWVSKVNQACLDGQQSDNSFTGANEYRNELNRIFRKNKKGKSLTDTDGLKDTAEPILKYKKLSNEYGNFGYFKLESFVPEKLDIPGVVNEFKKLLDKDFAKTDGIIIDLRDNGGGLIQLAESLVELFDTKSTMPMNFREKVSPANLFYMGTVSPNDIFTTSMKISAQNGQTYSADLPLDSTDRINTLGQHFFKPVALFMNASCYSSCDMFSAQMQDHGAGIIFGEDQNTGAGGANNYNIGSMYNDLPKDNKGPFKMLPAGQNVGFAFRQSIRVGKHAGELIEDFGVQADALSLASVSDLYNSDENQLKIISSRLSAESKNYNSWALIKDADRKDVLLNQLPMINLSWGETSRIDYKYNGQTIGSANIAQNSSGTIIQAPSKIDTSSYLQGNFEMLGFNVDQQVWRKVVNYRVIPTALTLPNDQDFVVNLNEQSANMAIYTDVQKELGWNLGNDDLKIADGAHYVDDTHSEAAMFFTMPTNALKLNFNASVATEENYDYFTVIVASEGKEYTLLNVSGDKPMQAYSYDLSKLAGKKVEIRFVFDSDGGGNATGVTVQNITLSH